MSSLKKRYFSKLATNLIGFFISLVTASIVPRSLGPANYGNFSFITNFFWGVANYFNLNSSTAFYAKLSRRQDEKHLVSFYMLFVVSICAIIGFFLFISILFKFDSLIWPGQRQVFVIFGYIWAILSFLAMVFGDMSDAYGLTVWSEIYKMATKILGLVIVLLMFFFNWFTLANYFVYQLAILLVTTLCLLYVIKKGGHSIFKYVKLNKNQIIAYGSEFAKFCLPLLIFSTFSIFELLADRWFLQRFSGSVKQGYYALSYQISAVCFLFTSAIIPLIFREQSISFGNNDMDKLKMVFKKTFTVLYVLTAFFSCFMAVEAKTLLKIFGGQAYAGAIIPVIIMCLYPIHQTYGQLNATFFFSTERVKAYRNIGLVFVLLGILTTVILLGPKSHGFLQLGAGGLAIKMFAIQILAVNVQLFSNTKYLKLPFKNFLYQQIVVLFLTGTTAILSYTIVRSLIHTNFIIQFLLSGVIYSLATIGLLIFKPRLFFIEKKDVSKVMDFIKLKLGYQTI